MTRRIETLQPNRKTEQMQRFAADDDEDGEAPETPTDEPPPVPIEDPPAEDTPAPPMSVGWSERT